MIKPLASGILSSATVRAVVIAKLVTILGILSLTSFTLTLRTELVAKLIILGILSSISLILASYTSFLTTSFFTTSLSLLKSVGTDAYLSTSNLSTLLCKLFKPLDTLSNLSISNLSTSDFNLSKSLLYCIIRQT